MSHPTDDNRVPGSGNASHNRPDSSEQEIQQILADYGPNGRAPGSRTARAGRRIYPRKPSCSNRRMN